VSELGRGIDKFELDLFEGGSGSLGDHGLSEGKNSLSGSSDRSLEHDEIFVDNSVFGESSEGSDGLLGKIEFSGSRVLVRSVGDSVDLLVDDGSVVEPSLSSSGNGPRDSGRMPCSNTGNLSQSLVGLSGQLSGSPSGSNSSKSLSFGDSNNVEHIGFREDVGNGD